MLDEKFYTHKKFPSLSAFNMFWLTTQLATCTLCLDLRESFFTYIRGDNKYNKHISYLRFLRHVYNTGYNEHIVLNNNIQKYIILRENINNIHILSNVGKKVTGKKVTEKKSQFWVGKKVTGKKVTKKNYAFSQLLVRNKHFYFYYYHFYHFMFCLD